MKIRIGFLANHSSTSYVVYIPASYTKQCLLDDAEQLRVTDEKTDESRPPTATEIKELVNGFESLMENGSFKLDDESTFEVGDGDDALEVILEKFVVKSFEVPDGDSSYELVTQETIDNINDIAFGACQTRK